MLFIWQRDPGTCAYENGCPSDALGCIEWTRSRVYPVDTPLECIQWTRSCVFQWPRPCVSNGHALVFVSSGHALVVVSSGHALVVVSSGHALVVVSSGHALVVVSSGHALGRKKHVGKWKNALNHTQ
jgi:hypothetical protein